ncbi:hypothetical protein [Shinella zoogloeoides]|uniref:hypothetical protein n=1 Tax=Shinella zoogloeoides TaxID=352475 RepID=UPI00299D7E15|nr:hypothetical protein [Shinella zoogloeoides]WPE19939.1 hypothetical protein ShzoTeo12_11170 [Shinella zoogloeoides]
MISAARHNELVDFIMYGSEAFEGRKKLEDALVQRFPEITFEDLDKAMADAADRERELAAELDAEAEALAEFMPLFEGEPEGALMGEVATRKAIAGDPLALKFLMMCSIDDDD